MSHEREPAPAEHEHEHGLGAEDRRIVEALRQGLDPGPRTPAQRSAFSRSLEERLASRARPWRPLALAAGSAFAALALWLAVPLEPGPADGGAAAGGPSLLAYAYYETDLLEEAAGSGLPAEYEALASAFELP